MPEPKLVYATGTGRIKSQKTLGSKQSLTEYARTTRQAHVWRCPVCAGAPPDALAQIETSRAQGIGARVIARWLGDQYCVFVKKDTVLRHVSDCLNLQEPA